jgi:Fe-S cluster assembly iron-binding protein IscA
VVLKQAEELKTLNSQLTSRLHEVDAAKRQLQEEIAEHEQEALDVRAAVTKVGRERDELAEQLESTARAYQEAKGALKDKAEALFDKEFVLKEHAKLIGALESELKLTKETSMAVQKDSQQAQARMASRIAELESDKGELTSRLNNAVSTLEKSTARVVEDANSKLQAKDGKIKQADERATVLKNEAEHYRKLMEEYKRQLDVKEASHSQTVTELQASLKEERVANAQQAARILSLEGLADGFRDKILKLKTKDKETMDALRAQVDQHERELREKDRALHILSEQRDAERVSLMTEFERILEEKTHKHQTELAEAHAGATISAERKDALEAKHRDELLRLKVEHEAKEQFFQHQLQETENQVKSLIEHEIDANIKRLETQHQAAVSKLRHDHEQELRAALQEAMAASSASAHKQHQHALEQRHAVYTAELDTMRAEFQQQLKAAQEDAKAQQDALKRAHEDNVAKLGRTHQQALDALEGKISDQCERHYDQTLAVRDEKHRLELVSAVERERNRLTSHYESLVQGLRNETVALKEKHQAALKNIEYQRELHLQDAIEAERNKLLLQGKEHSEDQRAALAAEFADQLRDQERRLTAKYAAQLDSQRREVQGEQEQALQQLATEQRRQIDQLNAQKAEAEAHHVRELDLVMNSHKKALADARREAEVLMRVALEDAEREMQALRDQQGAQKVEHEERLREALGEQQKELIDRARSESLKLRTDLQGMEARHQAELNAALQAHVAEMAKQRKQLEAAQGNLVDSLQEELAAAKERCNELLALSAAKEAQDAAMLVEVKARADENTRRLLEERDRQHKIELDGAEAQATLELNKLRAAMEKVKQRHEAELLQREKEGTNEQGRAVATLKDKHRAEIAKLKAQHEQRMTATVQEIAGKGKLDHLRLLDERKEDETKHQAALTKLESKVRELTQSLQKQRVEFEVQVVRLQEEADARAAQAKAQKDEDDLRYSSLQEELENRSEAKHLLVLNTVREEAAAELARVKADAQAQLQRREAQLRQEIEQVVVATQEEAAQRVEELETLTAHLADMRRKHTAAAAEVKALQQELADVRGRHEEEELRANKLGSDVSEVSRRHAKEMQRLRDERAEYERVSLETEERLVRELQETKLASRKQLSEMQGALMQKDFDLQHAVDEAQQKLTSELQEQAARLKQAHQQQLEELRALKERDATQLSDARSQIAALNADLARTSAAMEALQRDCEGRLETAAEQAATEAKFLRDRITRMTQEAEDQAADIALQMEQRSESLMEQLEEARQNADQRHQEHLAELAELQAQMHAQIQAERVQKATELDELRVTLTTTHQREIRELRVRLEAGTAATSTVKDEMTARLNAALTEKEAQLRELQDHMKAQMAGALSQREAALKAEYERERARLVDQYEDQLQSNMQGARAELSRRLEEAASAHAAEIAAMQKRHAAALRDHVEDSGGEVITLHRQLGEKEEEKKDVQRQLVKSEAIREVLKQDTENMRTERQRLLEKIHVLELEIIEHGKAKFEARLISEKERLEQNYKSSFEEVNHEVALKAAENKQLADRLAHGEMEIAAMRASIRTAQEDRERLEESFRAAQTEKEAAHLRELHGALEAQQEQLQAEYLRLIQQQVDSLVGLIQNHSGGGGHSSTYGKLFAGVGATRAIIVTHLLRCRPARPVPDAHQAAAGQLAQQEQRGLHRGHHHAGLLAHYRQAQHGQRFGAAALLIGPAAPHPAAPAGPGGARRQRTHRARDGAGP